MIYIWLSRANELYLRCQSDTTASALYHADVQERHKLIYIKRLKNLLL